jgi:hypothetical protein
MTSDSEASLRQQLGWRARTNACARRTPRSRVSSRSLRRVRATRDEIAQRVAKLLAELDAT